jgi:hypothetical protein
MANRAETTAAGNIVGFRVRANISRAHQAEQQADPARFGENDGADKDCCQDQGGNDALFQH